ncbi:MAG: 2-amino-4-hydroxy-6-hydroxymethyldihydropteridine diphosphokinase [Opitutales bacterium]
MALSVIALGSNLGDRLGFINFAKAEILKKCSILHTSKNYETEPVGYLSQGKFLNAVILVETILEPLELLGFLQEIENEAKRERPFKNAPRTLDLDIIFYDNLSLNSDRLKLPHPLWQERRFVVEPLLDLEKKVPNLLANFGLESISLCEIMQKINKED